MRLLEASHFVQTPGMAASLECLLQERPDDVTSQSGAYDVSSHAEDIGVIMLSGSPGGEEVVAQSRPDAADFIGSDTHADARAANEDAEVEPA